MDDTSITDELERIRQRLIEIEKERRDLPAEDETTKKLQDEEHRLETRLAELSDDSARTDEALAQKGAADQVHLDHAPKLREERSE
jgi:predicted nuclease with TOPRIM domain